MRRSFLVVLPAFFVLGAVACGGGKGGSGPPGGYTHENGGRPVANGWDPFAPAQDPSPSGNDFPACSGEQTITVSQVIDAVLVPVCNMAATCGTTSQPPDTAQPATPGTSGGMATRDVTVTTPPSYCEDIYQKISVDFESDGFAGVCDVFEKVSTALKAYPECNPPMVVPDGLCIDALAACINDIVAMGCNPTMTSPPRSCAGISFGSSSGGSTTPTDPCQECTDACAGDTDCLLNCYENGYCN